MRLQDLKQRVREDWERRCWYNSAIIQPELFQREIRTYGDLRRRKTWINALCRFHALNLWESCMDSWTLIAMHFNFHPERWDYEFRHQILDEFLSIPGSLDALGVGFEQLLGTDDFTPQERETAHGLLAMVSEQSRGTGGRAVVARFERAQSQLQSSAS